LFIEHLGSTLMADNTLGLGELLPSSQRLGDGQRLLTGKLSDGLGQFDDSADIRDAGNGELEEGVDEGLGDLTAIFKEALIALGLVHLGQVVGEAARVKSGHDAKIQLNGHNPVDLCSRILNIFAKKRVRIGSYTRLQYLFLAETDMTEASEFPAGGRHRGS